MPSAPGQTEREKPPRKPGTLWLLVMSGAVIAAASVAILTRGDDQWRLSVLACLAVFTVVSDLLGLSIAHRVTISGSFLGIILAAVVLGGAPAALLGALTISVGCLRWREGPARFVNNLANFLWFPLMVGLLFHLAVRLVHADPADPAYYLLVFGAFVVGLSCNFAQFAIAKSLFDRSSIVQNVRELFVPMLPAELFSALLTVGGVYVYSRLGTGGLVLSALVFVVFQYLVGEMLKSQQRRLALNRASTTDDLTGLANRERYRHVVDKRIGAARDSGGPFAVMLVDLDRFKEINDALGHPYGDALLRDLGPRLVEAVGPGGLVARLGGDEFGILCAENADDPAILDVFLTRLVSLIGEPFTVDGLSLEVGASVGVARYPRDGGDAHALLRCADIAMYQAKEAQADYAIYEADRNPHTLHRLTVISDIRQALGGEQIVAHFQPIVDVAARRVRGAEALVRWEHPERGLIPPAAFVPVVERTDLIGALTTRVLECALAECAAWRSAGRDLSVSVNLSVRNLLDKELPDQIRRLLAAHRLPAAALKLEITESMIMSDPERALATLTRLSHLGVRLSVDDFGTGYSSLSNLRRMAVDELKIDRSFVAPMLSADSDLVIVRSTVNLGHDLGLQVVAEGVEDEATLERLVLLGCDSAQGYHLSRPLPADAFRRWMDEYDASAMRATGPAPALAPTAA